MGSADQAWLYILETVDNIYWTVSLFILFINPHPESDTISQEQHNFFQKKIKQHVV